MSVPVNGRTLTVGGLIAAGGLAAALAIFSQEPVSAPEMAGPEISAPLLESTPAGAEQAVAEGTVGNAPASPSLSLEQPEGPSGDNAAAMDKRRYAKSGPTEAVKAAKRVAPGGFVSNAPALALGSGGIMPQSADDAPAAASETGPIEFIVKMKDPKLIADWRGAYAKSPKAAEAQIKAALGASPLMNRARLKGFTMGGEAILEWDGPKSVNDFARVHDEIQRTLSTAPGVSYAEQNYTAEIRSAQ